MKLATWNVNGLRARLDFLRIWLRERAPDVVGLQELKAEDEDWARETFAEAGYPALVHGQKGWNGVAILAKGGGLAETQRDLPGQEEMGARFLSADVGGISFSTLYVPNGKSVDHEDFPRKLAWLDALVAHARALDATRPAILCGDFNLCATSLDSCDEETLAGTIFHTPEERERFAALAGAGFTDLFRSTRPADRLFSWWDYRAGAFPMNRGLRIDLILGTAPVLARTRSVSIDRDFRKKKEGLTPSDHAPVILEIE